MSLQPFSKSEKSNLIDTIEKNGWQMNSHIENYFRYSLKKNKLIIFTIKIPIRLPVRLNIPFEVVNFQVSLAFKIWNINPEITKLIINLMKMLRNFTLQVSIEHHFPIKGKEKSLLEALNLIIPPLIKKENNKAWTNRIRISLMNKRAQFESFDNEKIEDIVGFLKKDSGLEPCFKQPWELNKGIPKIRTSETLFFSNDEIFDEFFLLERGFFTYLKDLEYNKFYIRTFFESYSPYILYNLFKHHVEFKIEVFIKNWIKSARLILNSIIEIIENNDININELIKFNVEKELESTDFILKQNSFCFSALHYESIIAKQLFPIHNDLLNSPPINFQILDTIREYTNAEEYIKNYKFDEATKLLNSSLKVFNLNRQKKAIVSTLMQLRKISKLLNQKDISLNYINNALSVAKSEEVPIEFVIKIHYNLGKTYFNQKLLAEALNHFTIIINSFEKEEVSIKNNLDYKGMAHLFIGLINLKNKNASESKSHLKKAFIIGNESLKVKLNFYLYRAKHYKNSDNLSQAQKLLRLGIDTVGTDFNEIDTKYHNTIIDLMLELAEFYIYFRKDSKKANYLLKTVRDPMNIKQIPGINRIIRWNLLMADFFKNFVNNREKIQYYLKKSQELKSKLRSFGVK